MPLKYKIDVLQTLKDNGYNTTRIKREKIFNAYAVQKFRTNESVTWETLEKLCSVLKCQPGDIIEYTDEIDGAETAVGIKRSRSSKKEYRKTPLEITTTEDEKKKLLESYFKTISDIAKVFDTIIEFQNNIRNNLYLQEYNKVRFCALVFRIYEIAAEDIINLTADNVDVESMVVKTSSRDVEIDIELFKYVDFAVQYATQHNTSKLITSSGKHSFANALEFKNMMSHFSVYCNDVLYQMSYKPTTTVSPIALRDSVKFEKVLKADTEIGLTHDYTKLKEALWLEFPPKNKDSNVYAKIALKYEMYIKWYKVFYETEEGQK